MNTATNKHSSEVISSTYSQMTNQIFDRECFSNMQFSGSIIKGSKFTNVVFVNCNFQATEISNCMFIDCHFVNCNFEFSKFKNCNLIACKLDNCHFCITNSLNCNYLACTFIRIDWEDNFHSVSKFENCVLEKSHLPLTVKPAPSKTKVPTPITLSQSWETLVSECLMQAA